MKEPLVSILMTAYNRQDFISDSILSVVNSDYLNWELIIVDDCSIDNTYNIALSFASKDKRINVYRNDKNVGDYPNRNIAASYAKGKYLKYLDADDLIYPHGISVMVKSIEKFPNAGLALCKPDTSLTPLPKELNSYEAFNEHFRVKNIFTNSPLGAIILREAFIKVGGFSGTRFIGDTELWMKLALEYPIVLMVMGLGFWRSHGEQEKVKGITSMEYPRLEYNLVNKILNDIRFPLKSKKNEILFDYKKSKIKSIILSVLRRKYGLKTAYKLLSIYK